MFMADRLGIAACPDIRIKPAPGVFSPGFASERQPPFSEALFEKIIIQSCQVADAKDSQCIQTLLGDLPYARDVAHIKRREKSRFLPWNHPQDSVRFRFCGRDLCDQARAAYPDRAIQICAALDFVVELVSSTQNGAVQPLSP